MDVSVAEAKNRLPALIRAMEDGETIVITRNGRPVAQLAPPPAEHRQVRFDGMRDRIQGRIYVWPDYRPLAASLATLAYYG